MTRLLSVDVRHGEGVEKVLTGSYGGVGRSPYEAAHKAFLNILHGGYCAVGSAVLQ